MIAHSTSEASCSSAESKTAFAESVMKRNLVWLRGFACRLDSQRSLERADRIASQAIEELCEINPPLSDECEQRKFLRERARFRLIDEIRVAKAHPYISLEGLKESVPAAAADALTQDSRESVGNFVRKTLTRLEPKLRQILEARFLRSQKGRVIASQFHVLPGAVWSRLSEAKAAFRACLELDAESYEILDEMGLAPPRR
ncbi:MAG: hypothetical protein FD180_4140 [Planctomycetota bacterium]|nr:MAG: hypothetical protein FD180_4140 [Planctomycetota bacterium]